MDLIEIGISICLGIGLATAVGFRVFLPLLILSIAGYYGKIPINESWQWAASMPAIITLGVATVIEIFGYYIPWFDNLLDSIAIPLAAIAGTAVVMATMADINPVFTWALAIIAGGGTAAVVKGNTSALRLTSSTTTGGFANPVISTAETGTSTLMSLLSVFIAPLAFVITLFIFFGIYKIYKKLKKKKDSSA